MDSTKLGEYYRLTKPGIVQSNVLAALAGYLFASAWHINWSILVATLLGTGLVIASSCVINNYIDRTIDARMERTSKRALVSGRISVRSALVYAATLALLGFVLLVSWTNWLVVATGAIGMFSYLVIYGWGKRHTVHGTLLGTISGSMPLLAGYVAYTNMLDVAAWLLVAIMTVWQMAHFFSIALYRVEDYERAGLPVAAVLWGPKKTLRAITGYILLFALLNALLSLSGHVGKTYLLLVLPVTSIWLWSIFGHDKTASQLGRSVFLHSLVVLLVFLGALSFGGIAP